MKRYSRSGTAMAVFAALLATTAFAQDQEEKAPGQMMQGGEAMSGDVTEGGMQGMMPMMKMMEKMGPMMEACTEMMQAMSRPSEEVPSVEEKG